MLRIRDPGTQMSLEQAELQPLFSVRSVMSPAVSYPGGKKGKRQVLQQVTGKRLLIIDERLLVSEKTVSA